jgi:hypothetical protein
MSFSLLKLLYFGIQTLNLVLVLVILKKISNKVGFILGGILFVLINYFVTDGNLWYELVITSLYLFIFLVLQGKHKYKNKILGILVTLASFIKPTAAIILFPVVYLTKSFIVLFYFSLSWVGVFIYFWIQNGLRQLIDNLFLFNSFLSKHYRDTFFSDEKFLTVTGLIIVFSIILYLTQRKIKIILPTLCFLVIGIVFVFYAYARYHLVPMAAFFVILVGQTITHTKKHTKALLIIILLMYLIFLGRKVKFQYYYLKTQAPWIENRVSSEIVSELKSRSLTEKKMYVFGSNAEIYFILNKLPPTKYPLIFPLVDQYIPDFEERLISELKQNNVNVIVIPKPLDRQHSQLSKIINYIHTNYSLFKKEKDFEIYIR